VLGRGVVDGGRCELGDDDDGNDEGECGDAGGMTGERMVKTSVLVEPWVGISIWTLVSRHQCPITQQLYPVFYGIYSPRNLQAWSRTGWTECRNRIYRTTKK
jgi:hypothetical protein